MKSSYMVGRCSLVLAVVAGCIASEGGQTEAEQAAVPVVTTKLVTREVPLGKPPLLVQGSNVVVSPDKRHVAYPAIVGGQWKVCLDGVAGPGYGRVGGLVFSPDSKRLAYGAKRSGEWLVVVDGQQSQQYERFLRPLRFEAATLIRVVGVKEDEMFNPELFGWRLRSWKRSEPVLESSF